MNCAPNDSRGRRTFRAIGRTTYTRGNREARVTEVVKNQEEEMTRSKVLALSSCVLIAATVACSQYKAGAPIRVVRNDADVASCQRVVDVDADRHAADSEIVSDIANKARDKGADTVLLAQGARSGSAYRCGSPSVASKQ